MADEAEKLLDVAWQQIIFAIDEVEAAFGKSLRQLEGQQTFFLQKVVRRLFRDNGNSHTAGDKVFDGFLIVDAEGNVDMINVGVKSPSDPIEQIANLLDRSPEIIAKVKSLLGKDKSKDE